MKTALPTRLERLRARDVMNPQVVALRADDILKETARRLRDSNVIGAPVVSQHGHLVGILSATDLMTYEQQQSVPQDSIRQQQSVPQATVEEYMSPCVESISDDTLLVNIARKMCEGHHHRLVVVGEQKHVLGIVSTMDILSALVGYVDEAEAAS